MRDNLERDGGDISAAMGPGIPCHPQSLHEVSVLPVFFLHQPVVRCVAKMCVHAEHMDHRGRGTV